MSENIPFTKLDLSRRSCEAGAGAETGHDRRERRPDSLSGFWGCSLEALTPLCIQAAFAVQQKQGSQAFLPGSSLRGMLRNVAEMLGAGCARYYEGQGYGSNLKICTARNACLVCRVFGFVEGDFAWAGKVRVNDSARADVRWLGCHLPRQRPAHSDVNGAGWMIFPATKPALASGRTWSVDAKRRFPFLVEYLNLDAEEYAVLKFSLTLQYQEVDLVHCLGYGKSLGLGACKISIPKDTSPPIGQKIQRYLDQPGFRVFRELRDRSRVA